MTKRLIVWFVLLILITVFSLSWAINRSAGSTFQAFRNTHTQAHLTDLPHLLGHYYSLHGSWKGVEADIEQLSGVLSMRAVLVDIDSNVIATTGIEPIGSKLAALDWAEEIIPIMDPALNVPVGSLLLSRSQAL
ncbi:MAG: hypothetical protein AAF902_26195, partial [Chloroflexota bacterium]